MVADAATVDSRARYTLPMLLKVVGKDPRAADTVALLKAWLKAGAHRVDRDRDGAYAHQQAIAVFDEWWESQSTSTPGARSVAKDVLRPRLGPLAGKLPKDLDNHPRGGRGSAWNEVAWYGYVSKDLRALLGRDVTSPYSRAYCGRGSLARCRATLRTSLEAAVDRVLQAQGQTSVAGSGLRQAPGRHPARDGRPGRRPADRLAEPADLPAGGGLPQPPLSLTSGTTRPDAPLANIVPCRLHLKAAWTEDDA